MQRISSSDVDANSPTLNAQITHLYHHMKLHASNIIFILVLFLSFPLHKSIQNKLMSSLVFSLVGGMRERD
jgi:hypothetical protein